MHSYFAFVVHPQSGDVLTDDSYGLPSVVHGDITSDLHTLCSTVQNLIHNTYRLILLRAECQVRECPTDQHRNPLFSMYLNQLLIFGIVSGDSNPVPRGFQWIPREKSSLIVTKPTDSPVAQFLQQYKKSGLLVNLDRLHPYSRPGWFEEVASWIRITAFRHNYCVNDIQQVSKTGYASVLRATCASDSSLYFKHVGPTVFFDEIRTLLRLSEHMPDNFEKPIAVDTGRKWMLLRDQGSPFPVSAYSVKTNRHVFQRALRKWATIQKQSIALTGKLIDSGVVRMDSENMQIAMHQLVSDSEWCSLLASEIANAGNAAALNCVRANKLLIHETKRLWDKASSYNIPMALVHGEMAPGNVVVNQKDEISFINFGSTCVSFPLRDAVSFAFACDANEDDLNFYFEMWAEYETVERMKELFQVLNSLMQLDMARALYRQFLMAEQSNRMSSLSNLRTYIRFLLKWLKTCL